MHLHALTNKMVLDANNLSIEELPEVATSQNNVEYRLNFNKFNLVPRVLSLPRESILVKAGHVSARF